MTRPRSRDLGLTLGTLEPDALTAERLLDAIERVRRGWTVDLRGRNVSCAG